MRKERRRPAESSHTLPLRQEKPVVSKQGIYYEEIIIHKKKIQETKRLEVQVKREEMVIERRKRVKQADGSEDWEIEQTEVIPLKQEKIRVQLQAMIKEEIVIQKQKHSEQFSSPFTGKKEELLVKTTKGLQIEDEETEEIE